MRCCDLEVPSTSGCQNASIQRPELLQESLANRPSRVVTSVLTGVPDGMR